jgi:hypothetical protein
MIVQQEEFCSKPDTEVWITFDCSGPGKEDRLHRERRAWSSCAAIESLGDEGVVLVVRPGGAKGLAR